MAAVDDVNVLYARTKIADSICHGLFWLNTFLAFVALFVSGVAQQVVLIVQLVGTIIFIIGKIVDDGCLWYSAEKARRQTNIQNALNLQITELNTDGYYNNDFSPSIFKYAVNTFESNYFTKVLAGKMMLYSLITSIVSIVVLIVTTRVIDDGNIVMIIVQAIFSAYIVEDTVMLLIYKVRMDALYESAYSMFISVGINSAKDQMHALPYVIEYESIKSHYKIRINSSIFKKSNEKLSSEWENIKSKIVFPANKKS